MQTRSKKPAARPEATQEVAAQLERFKAMAQEVGADETPGALERSFRRLNPKAAKAPPRRPAKSK